MAYESISLAPNARNISGETYQMLTAIVPVDRAKNRQLKWLCICECGTESVVAQSNLLSGNTRSCGCLGDSHPVTHGQSSTTEYTSWEAMKGRCLNENNPSYHCYGGRGITVCDRWMKFEDFYSDMGGKPTPDHSIDRINNDGHYEPGNCRWATKKEQANNRRTNRK